MLNPTESVHALTALFRRRAIAEIDGLRAAVKIRSRMSVFRRLSAIGDLTSYTHAGRFCTLRGLPAFARDGLWCHDSVCFSTNGTLKSTVLHLVEQSDSERTRHELQVRLRIRVHNTLLDLVRQQRIGREPWVGQYLYVSPDARMLPWNRGLFFLSADRIFLDDFFAECKEPASYPRPVSNA